MNVLRAVIYVRLSRTTESSTSLARQEASCRGYAERQGWTVLRVFQDSNVSGGEPPGERPALRELCENLSHYDVLLTWRADRIARSLIHFSSVIEACDTAGVRLVAIEDGWDMSTPHGRFAANVLVSFAQFERELGRERTVSSQNHLRKTGRWAGGRVPYGLRPTPNTEGRGKILIRDDRAEPRVPAGIDPTRNLRATASQTRWVGNARGRTVDVGRLERVVSRGAWKLPGRLPGSCRGQLAATPTCEGGGR